MKDGVLHLVNSYTWYDMIECGEKPEEYRDISVWKTQICRYGISNHNATHKDCMDGCPFKLPSCSAQVPTDVKVVCFHRGYTNHTMRWTVEGISIGVGNPKWGAPKEEVFIIKLGKRIS